MYALSEGSRLRSLYDLVLMEAHLECNMQEASRPEWCLCLYFKQLAYCGIFYEPLYHDLGKTLQHVIMRFSYLYICKRYAETSRKFRD